MTAKTYLGIRRVPRVDYLIAFLESVRDGYNREDARRRIQRIQERFEAEKARVLGKQKPRRVGGASIVPECEKMALQLRFATRSEGRWQLTSAGQQFLQIFPGEEARIMLITRLWQVYRRFGQIILAILNQPDGEVVLPVRSAAGSFKEIVQQRYGIDCDVLTFNMVREIGTQLELLNWYLVEEGGKQLQRVYAIVCVATLKCFDELNCHPRRIGTFLDTCLHEIGLDIGALTFDGSVYTTHTLLNATLVPTAQAKSYLVIETQGDYVFIRKRSEIGVRELEQALWEIYLEKVNYRPLFPVLYPELRNAVCHRLRLPDNAFDQIVLDLIENPQRLHIYPSGGILNYASNLAYRHKYVPPKTSRGHFVIYLKIDRVKEPKETSK